MAVYIKSFSRRIACNCFQAQGDQRSSTEVPHARIRQGPESEFKGAAPCSHCGVLIQKKSSALTWCGYLNLGLSSAPEDHTAPHTAVLTLQHHWGRHIGKRLLFSLGHPQLQQPACCGTSQQSDASVHGCPSLLVVLICSFPFSPVSSLPPPSSSSQPLLSPHTPPMSLLPTFSILQSVRDNLLAPSFSVGTGPCPIWWNYSLELHQEYGQLKFFYYYILTLHWTFSTLPDILFFWNKDISTYFSVTLSWDKGC